MRFKAKYKPELICSKDCTRASIMEPHVGKVKGKPCLTATDGRRLVVIPVDAEESEFGRLPKEALVLARQKRSSKKQETVSLGVNGCITLENGWTLPRPDQETLKYPNVEQVIPDKHRDDIKVSFDARLLFGLAQSMGVDQVILQFKPHGAITVSALNEEAFGVLMPIRIDPS